MLDAFRENLKYYRKRENYSQESLSRKCHYDKTYVGKIERGDTNPSVEAILRIANVLEVPTTKLLQGKVSSSPDTFRDQLEDPSGKINKLFAEVFENIPAICLLTNEDGTVLQLNEAARKFLKADANDVVGVRISEIPFWGLAGVDPSVLEELCDLGAMGKKATRRITLRYKGRDLDLQVQVSFAEGGERSGRFVILQFFFVEENLNRTFIGDHFDLLSQ